VTLSAQQLEDILSLSNDGIIVSEYKRPAHPIIFVNKSFACLTGYSASEVIGMDCRFLKCAEFEKGKQLHLDKAIDKAVPFSIRIKNFTKDGRLFWNQVSVSFLGEPGNPSHIVCINKDVSQEEYFRSVLEKVNILYREMSKRLEYTNETDKLTKLKTRGHLSTRGEFILGAAKREKLRLHAIYLKINNLKILESLGGEALSNECLLNFAELVNRFFCRTTDLAVRLNDDEFIVICIEDEDLRVVDRAEQLRDDVHDVSFPAPEGEMLDIQICVGIYSATPDKYTTLEELISEASAAVGQETHKIKEHIFYNKKNEANNPGTA